MAAARKQVQGSLWGRALARVKPQRGGPSVRSVKPVASVPTRRALTVRDTLWTMDGQTGRRVYVPLTVDGMPPGMTKWAGREWQHCGEREGVLLVPWAERDNGAAPLRWASLASGLVSIMEGGQAA